MMHITPCKHSLAIKNPKGKKTKKKEASPYYYLPSVVFSDCLFSSLSALYLNSKPPPLCSDPQNTHAD